MERCSVAWSTGLVLDVTNPAVWPSPSKRLGKIKPSSEPCVAVQLRCRDHRTGTLQTRGPLQHLPLPRVLVQETSGAELSVSASQPLLGYTPRSKRGKMAARSIAASLSQIASSPPREQLECKASQDLRLLGLKRLLDAESGKPTELTVYTGGLQI